MSNPIQNIQEHEGKKYLRRIFSATDPTQFVEVDVYEVAEAFNIRSAPLSHALKKVLAAGKRGKGSYLDDLRGAIASISREIEIYERTQKNVLREGE